MIAAITNWRALLVLPILLALACQQQRASVPAEKMRSLASELYNRQLYKQSINAYETYLNDYKLNPQEQANVSFTIANTYFDRLNDYENALAYYVRLKQLYPESDLVNAVDKRIIECLERLNRSADAKQALDEATFLDQSQVRQQRPGEVVARIGNREITTGDLQHEMNSLPPFMLSQISDKSKKIEFLTQLIATELLYDRAARKGLDKDPEIIAGTFQAKKNLMVQKLLQEELSSTIDFDEDDLRTYFQANLSKYAAVDETTGETRQPSFTEVRQRVTQDYLISKQQSAYKRLIERLIRAEDVKIYEDKIQ